MHKDINNLLHEHMTEYKKLIQILVPYSILERIALYLKMFVGMGFFWTVNIIAGLLSDQTHGYEAW